MKIDHVTLAKLRHALSRLQLSSAYGLDNIPPFLVKDCSFVLEEPLLYLYNQSLQHGIYPSRWKATPSRVTPIHKGGSSTDISDYRPIAVLSIFGKPFESIINQCLYQQIDRHLISCQHGFRPTRSTLGNQINFVDYISTRVRSGCQVDVAFSERLSIALIMTYF